MGLLHSLGLPERVAGGAPAPADAGPPRATSGKPKKPAPAPTVEELAQWPSQAHRAWKRLGRVRQAAVAIQMASRYGQAFAKDFVAAANSGKTKLEGAHFVTALDRQTHEAMKAKGYKLAQYASNGDRAQEWWVRADGFEVFLLRVVKPGTKPPATTGPSVAPPTTQPPPRKVPVDPPIEPAGTCSKESLEQIGIALQWVEEALAEAVQEHREVEAEKARMAKLQVTTDEFAQAYEAMTDRLKEEIRHLESVIADVTTTKEALKDSGCNLSKLDVALDDLGEELIAFEVEKGMHEMDIRKPLKVAPKDMPDDDE